MSYFLINQELKGQRINLLDNDYDARKGETVIYKE